MFPHNEAELLEQIGPSLRILSRKEFSEGLLGVSVSTDKRLEKEDEDHPKFVDTAPNRRGVIERHGRAYVLLRFMKRLYLETLTPRRPSENSLRERIRRLGPS